MINEHKLRLGGVANLPQPLELGKTYNLGIVDVECREIKEVPNDDGTTDKVYKLLISELSEVNILNKGKVIHARKRGSQSKLLRYVIQQVYEQDDHEEEFDIFYQEKMTQIIDWLKEKYL